MTQTPVDEPSPPPEAETVRGGPPARVVSLLGQIAGYLGAGIGLTAAAIAFRDANGTGTQLAFDLVTSAVLLVAGWFVVIGTDASERMRSVLWFLASFTIAGFVGVLFGRGSDLQGTTLVATTGAIVSGCALALWWLSRRSLQLVVLFVAIEFTLGALLFPNLGVTSLINPQPPSFGGLAMGTSILGWLWLVAGLLGILRPRTTALVLGSIAAILGPSIAATSGGGDLGRILSLASAVAVLAIGELNAERALAGLGIAGSLLAASSVVGAEVSEQGAAVALLVVGLVLLAIGLVLMRRAAPDQGTPPRPDDRPPALPSGAG